MTLLTGLLIGSIIASLAGAGASVAGSVMNKNAIETQNATNIALAEKANEQSIENTEASQEFQREAAQKAHQWEVADLKAAGLNPILSAGGSGAMVPGTSVAQTHQAQVQAEKIDLSGVNNLLSNLSNTMLTQALINGRMEPYLTNKGNFYGSMADRNDFFNQTEMFEVLNTAVKGKSLSPQQIKYLRGIMDLFSGNILQRNK